ncbi:MAG: 3-hydroxyacyl-CoA dehydrogenase NAD-binding domain-containing protein [Bacteriovoracaceae bacterium]
MFTIKELKAGIALLEFNDVNKAVNVLDENFLTDFSAKLDQLLANNSLKGVVIRSLKPGCFCAGADLDMILKIKNSDQCLDLLNRIHTVFNKMESSQKCFVTLIEGVTLGGGFEFALASHFRLASTNPAVQFGLPEVTLGLIPGAGGTQRLPRMIGIEKSMPLLMLGKKLNAKEALELKVIDGIVENENELVSKAVELIEKNSDFGKKWITGSKTFKIPGGSVFDANISQIFMVATAQYKKETYGNYPAPLAILNSLYQGTQLPFNESLKIEANYFTELILGQVAPRMIQTLFHGMNECNKLIRKDKNEKSRKVKKVGVLGAGMMGAGIAYVSAYNGIEVVLKDVSMEVASGGKEKSKQILEHLLKKGKVKPEKMEAVLNLIKPTVNASDFAGCDLVIEAVIENREIKKQVINEVEKYLDESAIIASNTSTLPITGLSEFAKNRGQFIGLHFFSPVEKMNLVEIIMGKETNQYALNVSLDYVKQIKKTPIVVNDGRGFFTSRVFTKYIEEGVNCLEDGVASSIIENGGKIAGMPVGPLAVADEVSLDLIDHIIKQTEKDLKLPQNQFSKKIHHLVHDLNRRGRKVKKGFYNYNENGTKELAPEIKTVFPVSKTQPPIDEVVDRLLYAQVIESLKIMHEKIVTTKTEADVGSILGWGFPPYTGGVISFIDFIGKEKFINRAKFLAQKYGERFNPPAYIL